MCIGMLTREKVVRTGHMETYYLVFLLKKYERYIEERCIASVDNDAPWSNGYYRVSLVPYREHSCRSHWSGRFYRLLLVLLLPIKLG